MPSGLEVKAAIKRAATWGTPVACGAGDGILLTGDSLKKTIGSLVDDSLGNPFLSQRDNGEIKAEGGLSAFLRYDSLDVLLALVMGDTQAPAQQGGTAAYANNIKLKSDIDALFATLAVNKAVNVFEYPSAKISGFRLRGEMGRPVEIEFDVIADDEVINSSTNTLATFAGVTYPEKGNRVLMSHGVLRMNDQGGGALADGDKIYPSAFELSFKRRLKGEYVVGGANMIDEPTDGGIPEARLKLTFPRYSATTYFADLGADARKKMDIVFTGGLIEPPYYRKFALSFPHLALISAEAATEKGTIKHLLEFECLAAETSPDGMPGLLSPFQVDVVNGRNSDPLA